MEPAPILGAGVMGAGRDGASAYDSSSGGSLDRAVAAARDGARRGRAAARNALAS